MQRYHAIISITSGAGVPILAERLREPLRAEDGDLGAQRTEALPQELTGLSGLPKLLIPGRDI